MLKQTTITKITKTRIWCIVDIETNNNYENYENFIMEDLYKELSYDITGASFLVGRKLGCGFLEKVYEAALCYELKMKGHNVERQKLIKILYDGVDLGLEYFADIVVDGKVIIELKAVSELNEVHKAQLINYLKATGMEFGMLINFGGKSVQIERFGNSKI